MRVTVVLLSLDFGNPMVEIVRRIVRLLHARNEQRRVREKVPHLLKRALRGLW